MRLFDCFPAGFINEHVTKVDTEDKENEFSALKRKDNFDQCADFFCRIGD